MATVSYEHITGTPVPPAFGRLEVPADATDWQSGLPAFVDAGFTLRELVPGDAPSLLAMLTSSAVTRFITPPPTTLQGFERFIEWAARERRAGAFACFGIVPDGCGQPVGVFQLRRLDANFGIAEFGCAMGEEFWGRGLFDRGARKVLDFAFQTIGVRRIEARVVCQNGRGLGAVRKLGAVQEGLLRNAFLHHGEYVDQTIWSILDEDWLRAKTVWGSRVH